MNSVIKIRLQKIKNDQIPEGYYKFKNNIFPNDWNKVQIANILKLVERPLDLVDDKLYEQITVKRNYGGIQSRGFLEGKNILVKNQFKIEEGDFVISKRQISHGACGVVPKTLNGAIVSNEYNVFRVTDKVDLLFFNYYVQLPFMRKNFFTASDGVHIEKLLFKTNDWLKNTISIPTYNEQKKISNILLTWDKAIKLKEKLLCKKRKQKRGLMYSLLTGEVRLRGFNQEWEKISLSKVVNKVKGKAVSVDENGKYPIIDMVSLETGVFKDFTNEEGVRASKTDLLLLWDGSRAGKVYTNFEGVIGSTFVKLVCKGVDNYFLQNHIEMNEERIQVIREGSGIPHMPKDFLDSYKLRLPSIEEQKLIGTILRDADQQIRLIDKELQVLRRQKKGIEQLLLTGIVRV